NCPMLRTTDTTDSDSDGLGDVCDNSASTPNPDQADGDGDGSGDACQTALQFNGISEDGGVVLEVTASARDPQLDRLRGTVDFFLQNTLNLPNIFQVQNYCSAGVLGSQPGEGIVFVLGEEPYLVDLAVATDCGDGQADFWFAVGPCS